MTIELRKLRTATALVMPAAFISRPSVAGWAPAQYTSPPTPPLIDTASVIAGSTEVTDAQFPLNAIESAPGWALASRIACRNVPAPEFPELVTVYVVSSK